MSEKLLPQNSVPGTFVRTMSRRSVLRGAGVVMALPWLESMRVLGAPAPFPKRFGVMFMGCGINEDHWSASGDGADMTAQQDTVAARAVEAQDQRRRRSVQQGRHGAGIHPAQTGSLLSGAQMSKGAILHSGMSVDQMIANTIGQDTAQSSIVLACDPPMTGYHETNFSMVRSRRMFSAAHTPDCWATEPSWGASYRHSAAMLATSPTAYTPGKPSTVRSGCTSIRPPRPGHRPGVLGDGRRGLPAAPDDGVGTDAGAVGELDPIRVHRGHARLELDRRPGLGQLLQGVVMSLLLEGRRAARRRGRPE